MMEPSAVDEQPLILQSGQDGAFLSRVLMDPRVKWRRPMPEFVADLAPLGTQHSLFDVEREKRAKYRTTFGPTLIYGSHHFHALLDESGRMSLQEIDQKSVESRIQYQLDREPWTSFAIPRLSKSNQRYFYQLGQNVTVKNINSPIFFGSPIEPDNFGMWLLNGLPSIADYITRTKSEKLLCWIRFEWQREMLRYMGVSDDQLVAQTEWCVYRCPEVTLHQYSNIDLAPTETDMQTIREVLKRCGTSRSDSPSYIYISRAAVTERFGRRKLMEEYALIDALAARGFAIIEPEKVPFVDQIHLFQAAKVVVGLGGAGLFSTVFCKPGTAVVSIESFGGFAENHASLFAGIGLRYAFIFGQQDSTDPMPVHKRWNLDVRRAVQHIVAFMRQ